MSGDIRIVLRNERITPAHRQLGRKVEQQLKRAGIVWEVAEHVDVPSSQHVKDDGDSVSVLTLGEDVASVQISSIINQLANHRDFDEESKVTLGKEDDQNSLATSEWRAQRIAEAEEQRLRVVRGEQFESVKPQAESEGSYSLSIKEIRLLDVIEAVLAQHRSAEKKSTLFNSLISGSETDILRYILLRVSCSQWVVQTEPLFLQVFGSLFSVISSVTAFPLQTNRDVHSVSWSDDDLQLPAIVVPKNTTGDETLEVEIMVKGLPTPLAAVRLSIRELLSLPRNRFGYTEWRPDVFSVPPQPKQEQISASVTEVINLQRSQSDEQDAAAAPKSLMRSFSAAFTPPRNRLTSMPARSPSLFRSLTRTGSWFQGANTNAGRSSGEEEVEALVMPEVIPAAIAPAIPVHLCTAMLKVKVGLLQEPINADDESIDEITVTSDKADAKAAARS